MIFLFLIFEIYMEDRKSAEYKEKPIFRFFPFFIFRVNSHFSVIFCDVITPIFDDNSKISSYFDWKMVRKSPCFN